MSDKEPRLLWFASATKIKNGENPNYLNAVFLGTVNMVLNLPEVVFHALLAPLFHRFFMGCLIVFLYITHSIVGGLSGDIFAPEGEEEDAEDMVE